MADKPNESAVHPKEVGKEPAAVNSHEFEAVKQEN